MHIACIVHEPLIARDVGFSCTISQHSLPGNNDPTALRLIVNKVYWNAPESESAGPTPRSTSENERTEGAYPAIHAAWKISGVLLLLVLSLGALLVWQAPAFVQRSALSIWKTAKALWDALGQIGDASGGLIVIILVLSIAAAGMRARKQFRQILHDLWERLT